MISKKSIIKKFKNKILAHTCYKAAKQYNYVDDFIDKDKLLYILYEIDCTETVLTKDGVNFLKEYYGLEHVAKLIQQDIAEGVDFQWQTNKNIKDIVDWLNNRGRILLPSILDGYSNLSDSEKSASLNLAITSDYSLEEIEEYLNLDQKTIIKHMTSNQ